ncbi:hypothetical protein BT69DRAFT_1303195 [Atractiella rhizophila]|nr:hypothetical protein BT69DRAFT_1303195 [Atractiella rhizophila]
MAFMIVIVGEPVKRLNSARNTVEEISEPKIIREYGCIEAGGAREHEGNSGQAVCLTQEQMPGNQGWTDLPVLSEELVRSDEAIMKMWKAGRIPNASVASNREGTTLLPSLPHKALSKVTGNRRGSITRFGAVTSVWRNLAAFTKAKPLIKYSIRAKDPWYARDVPGSSMMRCDSLEAGNSKCHFRLAQVLLLFEYEGQQHELAFVQYFNLVGHDVDPSTRCGSSKLLKSPSIVNEFGMWRCFPSAASFDRHMPLPSSRQKLLAIKTALTFWKATEKLGLTSSQIKTPFCASIEMS